MLIYTELADGLLAFVVVAVVFVITNVAVLFQLQNNVLKVSNNIIATSGGATWEAGGICPPRIFHPRKSVLLVGIFITSSTGFENF